jgi:WhiB family redox-sensing transcriptional regulator
VAISLSEPELQALMIGVDLARLIPPRPAWMVDAACREHPEVDFFPGRGGNARPALAVCRVCGVRETCLTYGQENGEFGVWGGQPLTSFVSGPFHEAPFGRVRRR